MPRVEDAEALVEAYADRETMRYIGDGSTADVAGVRVAIEKWLARWDADGIGFFVLERGEAARALLEWTDRARLISLIQHGNERSVRVAEKIGERYERDVVVRGMVTRLYAIDRTTATR